MHVVPSTKSLDPHPKNARRLARSGELLVLESSMLAKGWHVNRRRSMLGRIKSVWGAFRVLFQLESE